MERTLVSDLDVAQKVLVKGHLHIIRNLGKIAFLNLRDRSGNLQIVVDNADVIEDMKDWHIGTTLEVEGEVVATKATDSGFEMIHPEIKIFNKVVDAMPIEINKAELGIHIDTDLDNRTLSLRHDRYRAIFKIQGVLAQGYREFMIKEDCTEFFGPSMTSASSEGGTEVFKLGYFDTEATLAQSNQLYKQIMVGVYERVFGMAKWFRAENSNTRRHLTEGIQYEFEMGFIDDFGEVMDVLDGAIRHMLEKVTKECAKELEYLKVELPKMPEGAFPRMKFSEVKEVLAERMGEDTSDWDDMTTEGERELCAYALEKFGSDFVYVTNFDKGVFYCYKDEEGVYQNFDLLCREAEIVSGGRRIDNHDQLVAAIKENEMDVDDFEEYLSIFKYGMPPHGGFGLGLERSTMMFLGLENVREASIFPSDPRRIAGRKVGEIE